MQVTARRELSVPKPKRLKIQDGGLFGQEEQLTEQPLVRLCVGLGSERDLNPVEQQRSGVTHR